MTPSVALVTGAGSGIGRAVALALLAEGYAVVLAGRRGQALQETADLAPEATSLVVPTDVGDSASVAALFATIHGRFGRLDVLFNNAGTAVLGTEFGDLTDAQWDEVVNVNLNGAFRIARGAYRMMRDQTPQGGRIINNGSISAHAPRPGSAPYTATKHAITGLTKSIALDGRSCNIACGQIDIGNAATEMTERMAVGALQPDGRRVPEPTMDVTAVARSVALMASLPLDANVLSLTVMATAMPFVGRG